MQHGRNLRTQFFVAAALGMVLLGFALSTAIGVIAGRQVQEDLGRDLAELAFHMGDKFDRGMWSRQGELAVLTDLDALRNPTNPKTIRRLLDRLQADVPMFSWIGYMDPKGNVVAASGGVLEGKNIAHRPVYKEAKDGVYIGDVHDAKMLAALLPSKSLEPVRFVDLGFPIKHPDESLIGLLSAHLSWDWAREIEESLIGALQERRKVEMYILRNDGEILLSPKGGEVFNELPLKALDLAKSEKTGWTVETWPDGEEYLTGFARESGYKSFPGFGWTILTRRHVDDAFAPIRHLQFTIAAIGGVFAVGFCAAFWFLAGAVTRPLAQLTQAADELAAGGGNTLPQLGGSEEIHRLSMSLRTLVAALTSSERRAESLSDLAHRDRLTGLANRTALEAVLDHLLPEARRNEQTIICLYLDLDGFKPVNDRLGHHAGDEVLKITAHRLRECMRDSDIAVRLGGDEFLAVMPASGGDWRAEAETFAGRILTALPQPMRIDGHEVKVGTSIGAAAWPLHHEDFAQVMAQADAALYEAKRGGKNRVAFAP